MRSGRRVTCPPIHVRRYAPTFRDFGRRSATRAASSVRAGGYELLLPPDAVDAQRFEALLADAARAVGSGRVAMLEEALALWRGPAFAGFEHEDWARPSAARWTELRDTASDDRAEVLIEVGRHEDAVASLEAASHDSPLRERTHRLLMTALQLCGRQGEALRVYERYRRRLATDLGLSPGEEICELEARIADGAHGREGAPLGGHLRGYRIMERIGEGAFSVVYRGEQPTVGRPVAIKVIRSELANRADFVRRFEAEAHLVARLEHPHIVPLYDYWREPGSAYLVMRLLSGTLEDRIRERRLDLPEALAMLHQIGSALSVAHRAGVVHRDVKPANIFGDGDGNWFLADFGIAQQNETPYRLGDLSSIGSPAYAPPEQLRREPVGPGADVYGLAIVLYESLTGSVPFPDARTQAELLRRRLHEAVPSMRALRPEVPASLDEVLARATAKDPADRYLTIDEMVIACRTAVEGRPSAPPTVMGRATLVSGVTRNPYKGLRAFQEADAEDFFGRQRLVERLVTRFSEAGARGRLLTVVGPSGSGKSSVVRAGLLPAIRRDAVPGSSQWFVTSMVPGTHPFEELEVALRRLATGQLGHLGEFMASDHRGIARAVKQVLPTEGDDLLLVIDQFEELFTLCADDAMRRAFIDGLVAAVSDPRSRLRVVLTLRADFYDRPLRYADLAPLVESGTVAVSPLTADELERAIVEPADRSGASFEPGLVARIIADFVDQPGALPLLQYAMTELFDDHVVGVLTIEAYERLGGLTGVLGRRAEGLYSAASVEEQAAAHRAMIRLVSLGEGTEDTRRRVRRSELGSDAALASFVDSFGDARLLSFDHDPVTREPTVEVAHEALIREWPRLREWLDEDRDGLRVHRHLTEVASEWIAAGRDEGELLRGARLETTEAWAGSHDAVLNDVERELLGASSALHLGEVAAEQDRVRVRERQNRRLRRSLLAVGLVAAVAVLASGLALQQRERANTKAAAARSAAFAADTGRIQSEAAQLASTNPRIALLLASEAYRRDPGPASLGALQQALVGSGNLLGYFKGGVSYGAVEWIDEHRFAAARSDGVDIFRDDGKVERTIPVQGAILLAASADGKRLAVAQQKQIAIFDLADVRTSPRRVDTSALIQVIQLAPDGSALAVGMGNGDLVVYDVDRWPKEDLRVKAHPEQTVADLQMDDVFSEAVPHLVMSAVRGVSALTFVPGTSLIATAGFGYARIWDLVSGVRLGRELPLTREAGGRTLATVARAMGTSRIGGQDEIVIVERSRAWRVNARTGDVIASFELPETRTASALQDSERQVVVAGRSIIADLQIGSAALIDIDHPTTVQSVETFLLDIVRIGVDPGRQRLLASSGDGLGIVSLVGDGLISRAFDIGGGDLQVTNDGATISRLDIVGAKADIWRIDGSRITAVQMPTPRPNVVMLTGVDRIAAVLTPGAGIQILELPSGRVRARLKDWPQSNWMVSFDASLDGRLVAFAARGGLVQVRSARDGSLIRELTEFAPLPPGVQIRMLHFDSVGRRLVGTASNGRGAVWDLRTGKATILAISGGDFLQATFTPDGKQLATLGSDGTVTMRDASTFQPNGRRFVGNTGTLNQDWGPYFSADGRFMMTAFDLQPRLWDMATGQQIGGTFPFDPSYGSSASRNLRWAVTGRDARLIRWDLNVDRWPDVACRAAGRNMTKAEWEQYGPAGEYVATCPQYVQAEPSNGG